MAGDISQIIGPTVANGPTRPAPAAGDAAPKVNKGPPAPTPGDTVSLSTQAQRAQSTAGTQNSFQPILVPGSGQKIRSFTETNRLVTKVVDPVTKKVIRQLPSEGAVQLKEAIKNLVSAKNQTD